MSDPKETRDKPPVKSELDVWYRKPVGLMILAVATFVIAMALGVLWRRYASRAGF